MFDVPGYRVVRVLGAVYGITVRTRNWGAALAMVIKSVAGGELKWFTNMVCFLSRNLFGKRRLTRTAVHCAERCDW
jgi:uncharacterized protein YbjQ (UPF0145 family)